MEHKTPDFDAVNSAKLLGCSLGRLPSADSVHINQRFALLKQRIEIQNFALRKIAVRGLDQSAFLKIAKHAEAHYRAEVK